MYPASLDTFSEHVDPVDLSLNRVDEMRIYRHEMLWQAGEPAMPSAVNLVSLVLLQTEGGERRSAGAGAADR